MVSALTDMLKDDDANIRAVATIALAKSGRNLLHDDDSKTLYAEFMQWSFDDYCK